MKKCLLGLLCLYISIHSFAQSLESDRLALVAIYNATATGTNEFYGGPNFNDITGWNVPGSPGDSPCGWTGVTCEGGRVTRLNLSLFQVHGPIAPEIGNLTALTYLNLQGAGEEAYPLVGEVPTTLGNLVNLEYLNISGNALGWANVAVIGNLTKLKELRMDTAGDYPVEFGNLANMETCVIGQYGPWRFGHVKFPDVIYQWAKIKHLHMAGLVYTTPVSSQIGNLSNLETLELGSLSGNIPPEIGQLTKLTRLVIEGNDGIGRNMDALPPEIGNLINLRYLSLVNNNLGGAIPVSLANLKELRELYLSGNRFSGSIPSFLGDLTKLQTLGLNHNQFSGVVPTQLTSIPALTYLNLFSNQLTGPLPDLSPLPSNFRVNLMWNNFTFAGLEQNLSKLESYAWQADIPMYANGIKASAISGPPATLSVDAGGTLSNNTYRWYKNNVLVATHVGNPSFPAMDEAFYHVIVTNSQLPLLTLKSVTYTITRLPVTLVSFRGTYQEGQAKLTWQTASETSNKGFEIERSADARTFEKIGFVDGSGDSKENQFYHFTDLDPLPTGYYRLKQLDYDGKSDYSRVIAVKAEVAILRIFPNPAQEYLSVSGLDQSQQLTIIDRNGHIVLKRQVAEKEQVQIGKLASGIYTVKIGNQSRRLLIGK